MDSQTQRNLKSQNNTRSGYTFGTIHAIWRHEHQISYNPFEAINIQQLDGPEPDPFTKTEIALILIRLPT